MQLLHFLKLLTFSLKTYNTRQMSQSLGRQLHKP